MRPKVSRLFLILFLLLVLQVPVLADIILIPGDPSGKNDYFDRNIHRSMTLVGQDYQVPEGMTVTLYENPEKGGILKTMTAGDMITISYTIEIDDAVWGIGRALSQIGWVRMGRLQKIYSSEDFLADYDADIKQPFLAVLDVSQFTEPIYVWTYPGSGVLKHTIEPEFFSPEEYYHEGKLEYRKFYIDPSGERWVYVGYFLVQLNGWILLDDLHNPAPGFLLNPVVKNTVTDTSPIEEEPKSSIFSSLLWITILIAAVTSITALAIYALKLPSKKKS